MSYDVVIVGSGPAACAACVALASHYSVALLHRAPRERRAPIGEHLAPVGTATLRQLGLDALLARHRPSPGILTSWATSEAILAHSYMLDPHGYAWNLDRSRFDRDFLTAAAVHGAKLIRSDWLRGLTRSCGYWQVAIETEQGPSLLFGRVLIDATGRGAIVARRLGAKPVRLDRLIAVTARLEGVPCADSRLMIEACRDGWWYTVPLAGDAMLVAFMSDSDLIPSSSPQRLRHWLTVFGSTKATRERVGSLERAEPRLAVAPAGTQYLPVSLDDGWMAIGDASLARDPLSGAGLAVALADAGRCPEFVAAAMSEPCTRATTNEISKRRQASLRRYSSELNSHYRSEHRWPEAPFWRRRTAAAPEINEQARQTST